MSMPFIAIKCVDEMCTLDSALVQCALLHRAVGTAAWRRGGRRDPNHILADHLTLSQSGGEQIMPFTIISTDNNTSPPDY